jgi:hypothetical protein
MIETPQPIPVAQLQGKMANLFFVTGYSYNVYRHGQEWRAIFDVSCQADLLTQPPHTPPPSDAEIQRLEDDMNAKLHNLGEDHPEYGAACLAFVGAQQAAAGYTGPPAPELANVGGWVVTVAADVVSNFGLEVLKPEAMAVSLEAYLVGAGVFPGEM